MTATTRKPRKRATARPRPRSKAKTKAPVIDAVSDDAHNWLLADENELPLRMRLARQAGRSWARLPVAERIRSLQPLLRSLVDRMDEIADLIVEENGKPRVEAIGQEVAGSIGLCRHLLDGAESTLASRRESNTWFVHRKSTVSHRALGAVLVISPWNIPLAIPIGQVLAALIAGNGVILKPSEETPRLGDLLGDLFNTCSLPPNLFTVIQGDGSVGAGLIAARPDKVFFTGSVATGRMVMAAAAAHPVPVCLEMGGVDAMIVCEDADLELASSAAVWGGTFNHGQVCASVERLLVHESIYDAFMARVIDKIERMDLDVDMGRITADKQRAVYQRHLADARERGLTLRCGGNWLGERKLAPTVIDGPGTLSSLVWTEETFGPLVAVVPFRDDDQAVAMHDDTPFGLTASVFSTSMRRATAIADQLQAGLVSINDIGAGLFAQGELPWGGMGESGFGRSHGVEGLLEFTQTHVVDRTRRGLFEFKRPWWYPYDRHQLELMKHFARLVAERRPASMARHLAGLSLSILRQLADHPRI